MRLTVVTFPDPQIARQELQEKLGKCCSELLCKIPARKEGLCRQQARLRLVSRVPRCRRKAAEVDRLLEELNSRTEELLSEIPRIRRELSHLLAESQCAPKSRLQVVAPLSLIG